MLLDSDCVFTSWWKRDRRAATLFMNPFILLMKDNFIRNVFRIKLCIEEKPCFINTQTSIVRPVIVILGLGQNFMSSAKVLGP